MEPSSPAATLTPREKWRLGGVLVGGVMIHLSLGTLYTFGNLNPYMTSYMRWKHVSSDLTYTECSWVFALAAMGQGAAMTFGGILEQRIGLRMASLMGCWLMSLGVFLTYLSIQHSFIGVVFTYGLMFGMGTGLAYALPLSCAMKWMPHRKGLMSGLIVAGFGGGAFIFDQVQKAYINPDDAEATWDVGGDKYFNQPAVLDKVPTMFLILGGCYAVMQFIGCLLLSDPPSDLHRAATQHQRELFDKHGTDHHQHHSGHYHRLYDEEENNSPQDRERTALDTQLPRSDKADGYEEEEEEVYSPLQMVRTRHFYLIFLTFFFMGQGTMFISTLYKAYGLTFISDDTFLSWTGTFAAVFNGLGRIFWGSMADRFSYKVAAMLMTCAFTCLLVTFQVTELAGKALFLVYVCLLFGCFSGSFALFPAVTAKCFGQKHVAKNYGVVFISQFLTAPIGVFASHKLQESIGWTGVFYYVAGAAFISFLLAIVFNAKDRKGRDV